MRAVLYGLDLICAIAFTIIALIMFFKGNYLASLAAVAIATHHEWAIVRAGGINA